MPVRYRSALVPIVIASSLVLAACSSDDDDDDNTGDAVTAPTSADGDTYTATIDSGSGVFATTGSFTISFSDTDDTYALDGDGTNVADASGTYVYTASGATATLVLQDSAADTLTYELTFTSDTAGTFAGVAASDPDASQQGRFTRQ